MLCVRDVTATWSLALGLMSSLAAAVFVSLARHAHLGIEGKKSGVGESSEDLALGDSTLCGRQHLAWKLE